MKKVLLIAFCLLGFSNSVFAGGKIDEIVSDIADGITQLQTEQDLQCHPRYQYALLDLAGLTASYVADDLLVQDLERGMTILKGKMMLLSVACVLSDMRNEQLERHYFYKTKYTNFNQTVKTGIKGGKKKLWFAAELLKLGVVVGISDISNAIEDLGNGQ